MKQGTIITALALLILGGVAAREVMMHNHVSEYKIRASVLESEVDPASNQAAALASGQTVRPPSRFISGIIKSIADQSVILTSRNVDYVITFTAGTSHFYNARWGRSELGSFRVGDRLEVYGPLTGTTMSGRVIRNTTLLPNSERIASTLPSPTVSAVPTSIRVTTPNGGEMWQMGSSQNIGWEITRGRSLPSGSVLVFTLVGPTPARLYTVAGPADNGGQPITVPSGSVMVGDNGTTMQPGTYRVSATLYDRTPCLGNCSPTVPRAVILAQDQSDASFTIVTEPTSATLGDLNGDSRVSLLDVTILTRHLSNIEALSPTALANADLDANGKVDTADRYIMRKVVLGFMSADELPLRWGDVNTNGAVTVADVTLVRRIAVGASVTISDKGRLAADVDMNDRIDHSDAALITGAAVERIQLPAVYGDVNGNYVTDLTDLVILNGFLDNSRTPTTAQSYLGDVYKDGVLNVEDSTTLRRYLLRTITSLPVEPAAVTIYGDLNDSGTVTSADITILRNFILGNQTPTAQQRVNADVDTSGTLTDADTHILRLRVIERITTLPLQPVVYGDLNTDTSISLADFVILENIIAGTMSPTAQQRVNGDLNVDTQITSADRDILRRYLNREITTLPVPATQ